MAYTIRFTEASAVEEINTELGSTDWQLGGGGGGYVNVTEASLRSAAADPSNQVIYINNEVSIAADITLPENITIEKGPLGFITAPDPKTVVTINGHVIAAEEEFFKNDFRVILGKKKAKAEWFEPIMSDGVIDESYNIITPSTGKIVHALRKAKYAVGSGGIIKIGEGVFTGEDVSLARRQAMVDAGNYRERTAVVQLFETIENTPSGSLREVYDDLVVEGSGIGKTICVAENAIDNAAFSYAIYRSGGWQRDFAEVSTYDPNVYVGSAHVNIRATEDATIYTPGMVVGLVAGSSYTDQDDMQFNVVRSVSGQRVDMEYPWERNFDPPSSSAFTFTLADFTVPVVGSNVTINVSDNVSVDECSIGNDAYAIVSVTEITPGSDYELVVTNLGKGNAVAGTIYPAETGLYKNRVLMVCSQTPKNLTVANMTSVGRRDIHINSNAVNIVSDTIEGIIATQDSSGGLAFNADGGYGFTSRNSVYRSTNVVSTAQIARSYTKVYHENDTFHDMTIEHTEFSYNARFSSCRFYMNRPQKVPGDSRNTVLRLGFTSGGVIVNNCDFFIRGTASVFSSDGIGQFQATSGQGFQITNNRFYLADVQRWWSASGAGGLVQGNQIYGAVGSLISANGAAPAGETAVFGSERTEQGRTYNIYNWGGPTKFLDNSFAGYIDGLVQNKLANVVVRNFEVVRHGPFDRIDTSLSTGSLVSDSYDPTEVPFHVDVEFDVFGWSFNDVDDFDYNALPPKDGNKIRINSWRGVHPGDVVKDSVYCTGDCLEAKDIVIPDPSVTFRNYAPLNIPDTIGDTLPLTDYNAFAVTTGGGNFNLDSPSASFPQTRGDVVELVGGDNTGGVVEITAINADNNRWGVGFRAKTTQESMLITVGDYDANSPFLRLYRITDAGGANIIAGTDVAITWPIGVPTNFKFVLNDTTLKVFIEDVEVASYASTAADPVPASGSIILLDRFSSTSRLFTQFSNLFANGNPAFEKQEITGLEFASPQIEVEDSKIDFTPFVKQGTGLPEGVISAPPGTLYLNLDGGANATLYIKESGTGNVGWAASGGAGGSTIVGLTESEYLALTPNATTTYMLLDVGRVMFGATAVADLSAVATPAAIQYMMSGAPTQNSLRVAVATESVTTGLRVAYSTDAGMSNPSYTEPLDTDSAAQVALFDITGLPENTRIYYQAVSNSQPVGPINSAKTSGGLSDEVFFAFGSCALDTDAPTWADMSARSPDFFLSLGDMPYMDYGGTDPAVPRGELKTLYGQTWTQNLLSTTPFIYNWDDHDYGPDNSDASNPAKAAIQQVYRELQPHYPLVDANAIYHAFTHGKVRFITMDLRSERVTNSIMDDAQMVWLKDELTAAAADADIKLVVLQSSVPWISSASTDTWFGFTAERLEIGDHILDVGLENRLVMVSGDMHGVAYDDGTNNTFNTAGVASFPVFQSAPVNHPNSSVKGGPYSGGTFTASDNQYSTMQVVPSVGADPTELDVVITAYGDNVQLYSYSLTTDDGNFALAAPTDIILSSNEIPEASADGSIVGALSADQPGALFTIVSDPSGNFAIDGNNLVTATGATLVETATHNITLRATNGTGFFDEAFTVTVTAPVLVGNFGTIVQAKETRYVNFTTNAAVTLDTTPTTGNLLVVTVAVDKNTPNITLPAGFTLLESHPGTSNEISYLAAYKISDGTETGPITSTWVTTSRRAAIHIAEVEGPFSTPLLSTTVVETEAQATSITLTPPAVVNVPSVALAFYMNDSANSIGAGQTATITGGYTVDPLYSPIGSESQPIIIFGYKVITSGETPTVTIGHTGGADGSVGYLSIFN